MSETKKLSNVNEEGFKEQSSLNRLEKQSFSKSLEKPETSKKERLAGILERLSKTGDIEGSAIITRDGLLISSRLPENIDGETFAAMSATMTGAAETAIQELKKSSPDRVIVESKNAKLITTGAGEQTILACIVNPDAKLGLVLIEMKKASSVIEKEAK